MKQKQTTFIVASLVWINAFEDWTDKDSSVDRFLLVFSNNSHHLYLYDSTRMSANLKF